MEAVQAQVNETLRQLRELRQAMQDLADQGAPPDPVHGEALDRLLADVAALEAAVDPRIAAIEADLAALDAAVPQRSADLQRLVGRPEVQAAEIDARLFDPAALEARVAQRRRDFEALTVLLANVWRQLGELEAGDQVNDADRLPALIEALADLSGRLLELSLVQAGARLEAISSEPVDLTDEEALLIASAYRRDWQNARASLVDTWRLIYFNANALRSDLDIVFSGDIGNLGDNPFRIRDTTGRLRAGIQFDAPLTRLAERNVYRQSLIEYQQARRNYYQFRDRVSQGLRSTLRQVRLNEVNFELRRAAVLVAISQVDVTQLRLSEPPPVGVVATASPTTARDLVQSLSDLLNVQNDFLSVWVNNEVQKMALEFDLGVMQLDSAGLRCDPGVPLRAYIPGAVRLRECLCNATDLYPGVGQVYEASPAVEQFEGEAVEPLQQPDSLIPEGSESLPIPPPLPQPPAAELPNSSLEVVPAAFELPPQAGGPTHLPPVVDGG
jgi:hypothetical protein